MKITFTPMFRALCALVSGVALAGGAQAATFVISNASTTAQSLTGSQTGEVTSTGSLTLGGGTVAVTMAGTVQLTNAGLISQTGSGRAIDSNTAGSSITVTNSGTIRSVSSDAFRVNNSGTSVLLNNSGTIEVTNGGQAIDWAGITTGGNTLNNLAGGIITAVGEDAVRPGQNGIINNAGTISVTLTGGASPGGSDGIDLRTEKNVTVTNSGTISGRHGIATDGANAGPSSLTLYNNAGGIISALNGSGINIDGVSTSVTANITNAFGATIKGGVLAIATDGDGDGVDVDGVVTLSNSGDILGLGAKGAGSDSLPNGVQAVSIGGGSITNTATGRIIGSSLAADAPNGDSSRVGEGILVDDSSGGNGIAATTVDNSGLIQGKSGAAIRIVGSFADTITNNAGGTICGAGTGAAIQTGGGGDTINNAGTITGDNGAAIDMQGGNNTLNVLGGSSVITGSINGGTGGNNQMTVDAGAGNTFTYSHQISNFANVEIKTGTTSLTAASVVNSSTTVKGDAVLVAAGSFGGSGTSLTVQDGGSLLVGGSALAGSTIFGGSAQSLVLQNGATVGFDIGGTARDSGYDYIGGTGLADLILPTSGESVHFLLSFLPGYTATAGDSFDLFDTLNAATAGGLYDFSAAPSGFAWNTSSFLSQGVITLEAVPEPSRALLGLAGFVCVGLRRRRRQIPVC